MHASELRAAALAALCVTDPSRKAAAVHALAASAPLPDPDCALTAPTVLPGRPARPRLVRPADLPRRAAHRAEGRLALLHSVAHIEFNAINLALDAAWRFGGLPPDYYADWLRVAAEEATHFGLLVERLHACGAAYGDLDAHNGLWEMAESTSGDVLARMALVPRTLEARGLDASPAVRAKLVAAGDHASAAVIDRILHDEIGHVAIGNRWFRFLCAQRGLDVHRVYAELAGRHRAPRLRGPFNVAARRAAGFDETELRALET
jgi:uncharacterized ferritin-like protein (DUF455 family)